MKPEIPEDLYFISLQKAFESEQLACEAMPRMAENAPPELKPLFERHTRGTDAQINRLKRCLQRFESKGMRAPRPQVVNAALAENSVQEAAVLTAAE